jgi:hypothetical protein
MSRQAITRGRSIPVGILVNWDNAERTILRWELSGHWDWREFQDAQDQSTVMLQTAPHTVDILADVSHNRGLPLGALGQFRNYHPTIATNIGRVIVVGAGSYIKTTIQMLKNYVPYFGRRYDYADSMDEARKLLLGQPASQV